MRGNEYLGTAAPLKIKVNRYQGVTRYMGEVKMFPSNDALSTQGEQQRVIEDALWASDEEHERWLNGAPEGWIICKERTRHGYVRAKRGDRLRFVGRTKLGLYVRRELCPDCRAVELVELWMLKPKRGTKNIVDQAELIMSYPNYLDKGYLLKPGNGRLKTSRIRELIVTQGLAGIDMRDLEREIAEYEASRVQVVSAS